MKFTLVLKTSNPPEECMGAEALAYRVKEAKELQEVFKAEVKRDKLAVTVLRGVDKYPSIQVEMDTMTALKVRVLPTIASMQVMS